MGFLSGLMGGQKTTVPASGFYSQPAAYQNLYNTVLGNVNAGVGGVNAGMFQPLAPTADEQKAFEQVRQGYAPTAESLKTDVGMFMSPFQQYVMDPVNRAAQSDFSILKQNASQAGQFGSNRQQLGASDIENQRLSTIGNLMNTGYQQAVGNVLNNLIPQRQQDTAGLLGLGDFERNLQQQQQQAPLQALQAQQGLLGGVPTTFGDFGSPERTVKTGGGLGGLLGGLGTIGKIAGGLGTLTGSSSLGTLGTALGLFSDRRLKENIEHIGEENGIPIYKFNYLGEPEAYIGVMADDVEKTHPEAVSEVDGYKVVNYDAIGIKMRAA